MIPTTRLHLFAVTLAAGCLLLISLTDRVMAQSKYALLVGVTEYASLPEDIWLKGPANDVKLFEHVLKSRLGFGQKDSTIVTLTQANKLDYRPTRANIVREIEQLIGNVEDGAQVLIFLSGHGTQQPNRNAESDAELDKKDEVFLPSDATSMSSGDQGIPNGILDDEINQWVNRLIKKGAFVWIVFDSCHSGTMLRGGSAEGTKYVDPELLNIPNEDMADETHAEAENHQPDRFADFELPENSGVVAMYACRPNEQAIETDLPHGGDVTKRYSLLSFAICQTLEKTRSPFTFRELMSQVRTQYATWGRNFPTPLVEGTDIDRVIFGADSWEERTRIKITRSEGEFVFLNAGSIHGYHVGSRFNVTGANLDNHEIIGQVEIVDSYLYRAKARIIELSEGKSENDLEIGSRCELSYLAYSDSRLTLAIDRISFEVNSDSEKFVAELGQLVKDGKDTLFALQSSTSDANWIVRKTQNGLLLVPASGVPASSNGKWVSEFLFSDKGDSAAKIYKAMNRIAKVRNILEIANSTSEGWEDEVVVELGLNIRDNKDDQIGKSLKAESGGIELFDGDLIGVTVLNQSMCDVEVFLFVIDSNFGINAFIPKDDSSLAAGQHHIGSKETKVYRGTISAKTTGKERILLIAKRLTAYPSDFRGLAQESIAELQSRNLRGESNDLLENLLASAAFGAGVTRGAPPEQVKDFSIKTLEWTTFPKR